MNKVVILAGIAVVIPILIIGAIVLTANGHGNTTVTHNDVNVVQSAALENNSSQEPNAQNASLIQMEGKPKIWFCDRVLLVEKEGAAVPKDVLKAFLDTNADLSTLGSPTEAMPVEYSCRPDVGRCYHNGKVCFAHAVKGNGWIIEWGMRYCDTGKPVEAKCSAPTTCGVYFTGIGCPHCAVTDPWLFYEFVPTHPIVVVEYEIYRDNQANAGVFQQYVDKYGTMLGVPQIIFDKEHAIVGDTPILQKLDEMVENTAGICHVAQIQPFLNTIGQ